MGLLEIRSVKITDKGQISIPKELRQKAGFKKGDKIAILNFDDHIELRPMDEIEEKFGTAFASEKALKEIWDSKEEDEAWKDL